MVPTEKHTAFPTINRSDSPWCISLLDVRTMANTRSTAADPIHAENAASFASDDGRGFIGNIPRHKRETRCSLTYRTDGRLHDGAVFRPRNMEEKWAVYFYDNALYFIRSWLREVFAVAHCNVDDGLLQVDAIVGAFASKAEPPEYTTSALDFILRSYALEETLPAPILDITQDVQTMAMELRYNFGRTATLGALETPLPTRPATPLRTDTAMHFALEAGDEEGVKTALRAGARFDTIGTNGLPAVASALRHGQAFFDWVIAQGAQIDSKADTGATLLGMVAQVGDAELAQLLIERGSHVDAQDHRGFTPLHRAAEHGHKAVARLLLEAGAVPDMETEGITPWMFAVHFEHPEIAELIEQAGGREVGSVKN